MMAILMLLLERFYMVGFTYSEGEHVLLNMCHNYYNYIFYWALFKIAWPYMEN